MLQPCARCRRHIHDHETRCPFCASPQHATPKSIPLLEGRLSRAAVFASAVLVTPACAPQDPPPQYIQQPPPPPPPPPDNGPPPDDGSRDYAKPPPGDPPPPPPVAETTVRGVITNANTGARYANIRVDLAGGARSQTTTTNANGEYVFTNVAPGDYTVIARVPVNPRVGNASSRPVHVAGSPVVADLAVVPYEQPRYDRNNIPKPYGAPPARHRIV